MIIRGSNYGDIRQQASREDPHGLTPNTIESLGERMEKFLPGLASKEGVASKQFFEGLLPPGGELDPRNKRTAADYCGSPGGFGNNSNGFNSNTAITPQRPYMPEFESPDRCCREGTKITMYDGSYKNIEDIKPGDKLLNSNGLVEKVLKQWCSGIPEKLVEIKLWGGDTLYVTENHNLPVWAWVHKCLCGCGNDIIKPGRCYLPHHNNVVRNKKIPQPKLIYIDGELPRKSNKRNSPIIGKTSRYIPENYEPYQKLMAKDLHVGDYLLIPRNFDTQVTPGITETHARLLGYYISEGCKYTAGNNNHLCGFLLYFGLHEKNTIATDALNLCIKLNIQARIEINKSRNCCKIVATGKEAKEFIKWCITHGGQYSSEKKLSEEVMHWPLELKIELIKGMFRGDGSRFINNGNNGSKCFKVNYTTVSPYLPKQIQLILAQLGYFACISEHRSKNAKIHHFNTFKLHIMGQYAFDLASVIWDKPSHLRKNIIRNRFPIDDNFIRIPIKSIKIIENSDPVYNITVSGDHSYLINNIGSFNSQYPVHRILANRYWRLFFKLDPTIGTCVDMFATMPWSDFQLTGEGVGGDIKESYEAMCQEAQLLRILEYMVKEFLVIGEAVPHNFLDESKGIWTYTALHNPDQLEVIDAPFIKMDPVVEFIPDDRLRAVLTSNNQLLRRVRDQIPPELISRLIARQNIPLSPINMTFIPRRLHPYDTRGTSIISRMWRILMYEDCLIPGSLITRPDGSVTPIEQLIIGDYLLDKNGKKQEVLNIVEKQVDKIITIKTMGKWSVSCTTTHNWPVIRDNELVKVTASDLHINDRLLIPRKFELSTLDIRSNTTMARLLGYYVAEGSKATFNKNGYGVAWALNVNEKDTWVKDIEKLCLEIGCDTKTYIHKSGCMIRSHKNENRWLADWLFEHGGQHATTKRLSSMVMGWPLELKEEFIRGFFRGDGSYEALYENNKYPNGTIKRTVKGFTTSETLAYQIQLILAQLGIFAGHKIYQSPCNDGKNRKPIHHLTSSGSHGDRLGGLVWGDDLVPDRTILDHRSESNIIITDDYIQVPIIEVSVSQYDGLVYGITVSGDHSYLNANIATYNSIYNASIVTARRHAGPLKIAKLGNPQTGWIPSQEHERKLLQLLAQAELDPNAWLVYHYGINFEMVGTTDRIMNISQHHETIERIKLVALGISKAFLTGEVTYASSVTGLSVFLQRLRAMRDYFTNIWVLPKFFKPIAKINGWIKRDKAELAHRYRIKRSQKDIELENRYIIPKIEWQKTLDHTTNSELITAMQSLEQMGIKFSKTTKYASVGRKFEDEINKIAEEQVLEASLKQYVDLEPPAEGGPGGAGGKPKLPPMPGGGGPPKMPAPGGDAGVRPTPGKTPPGGMPGGGEMPGSSPNLGGPTGEADKSADSGGNGPSGRKDPAVRKLESDVWDSKGRYGNWNASEIEDLIELLMDGDTKSPFWDELRGPELGKAINSGDPEEVFDIIGDFLQKHGYPFSDIRQLKEILIRENIFKNISTGDSAIIKNVVSKLPNDTGMINDEDMMERLSSYIDGERPKSTKLSDPELLFVGYGNTGGRWSGDIGDDK